ncbi:MAG: response regulator [Spirochaetaceae bacterium]|nr:MAG: response regulator [Spirochaetaceae bacterium]
MIEEQQQRQRLESIGRLAGGVAHDFNNLLTAINGYLYLLSASVEKNSKQAKFCENLMELSERAAYLTQQLHLYTRDIPADSVPAALDPVAENMGKMLNRIVGERILVVVKASGEKLLVPGDAIKVSQILLNLVMHAGDVLGSEGGTITLAITREVAAAEPVAVITVTAASPEGTALRDFPPVPAIVREIVNELSGEIEHPGEAMEGSAVRVILPEFRDTSSETEQPHETGPPGPPPTILLVEDEESILKSLAPGLEASGYRVERAATLAEARATIGRVGEEIAVAVIDLVLTDGPGTRLLSELRLKPDTVVILVTGRPDRIPDLSAITDRPVPVLRKPYTIPDLIGLIESAGKRND